MSQNHPNSTTEASAEAEQAIEKLIQNFSQRYPGLVFGEPVTRGKHTVIVANQVLASPDRVVIRPRVALVIGPGGIRVRRFYPPLIEAFLRISLFALFVTAPALILFPPWKHGQDTLGQVSQLITTIRNK